MPPPPTLLLDFGSMSVLVFSGTGSSLTMVGLPCMAVHLNMCSESWSAVCILCTYCVMCIVVECV